MYVTLEYLKSHSYINCCADEDKYLVSLIKTSEKHVAKWLQRDLNKYEVSGELPDDIKHAIAIYAATLYENREATSPAQQHVVPMNFYDLLLPYRNYGQFNDGEGEG
jgi:hypothetical protein